MACRSALSTIFFVGGFLLIGMGVFLLVPLAVAFQVEGPDVRAFTVSFQAAIFLGVTLVIAARGRAMKFSLPVVFLLTVSVWLVVSLIGSAPFFLFFQKISLTDAFFETVSGLTTTGATILSGLSGVPRGILLWRAMLQWIGGIGIIIMAISVLPFLKVGGMQLFHTESSDNSEKAFPRTRQVAMASISVYVAITSLCFLILHLEGMTIFDAAVHSMTTVSSGGFSNYDSSVKHFQSPIMEWTITVFMIAGALPFVFYVKLLGRNRRNEIKNSQVRNFLAFLGLVIVFVSAWLVISQRINVIDALRFAAFDVVSVVTTTGFVAEDYSAWGSFPVIAFFFLMFVGGCTGSTAGAIKFFRFEIGALAVRWELKKMIFPNRVFPHSYEDKPISSELLNEVLLFVVLYLLGTAISSVGLAATGLDFMTSISGAVSAIGNVGPGLGQQIGPTGNYANLPDAAKWIIIASMLFGRLEFFTVLVLFSGNFWNDL